MAKVTAEDRDRAEALLVDIEEFQPEKYEKMMKQGEKKAISSLAKTIAQIRERQYEMEETILKQMGTPKDPEEAQTMQGRAEMIAREMANEEISAIYKNP